MSGKLVPQMLRNSLSPFKSPLFEEQIVLYEGEGKHAKNIDIRDRYGNFEVKKNKHKYKTSNDKFDVHK